MDKSEFYDFMLSVIMDMERQGRYSTAHVYHCAPEVLKAIFSSVRNGRFPGGEVWRTLPAH